MRNRGPFVALDAAVAAGASPRHAPLVARLRAGFEARTGAFGPDDPWFEPRSRAFWDDAATTAELASAVMPELDEDAAAWLPRFGRAHRGLFRATKQARTGSLRVLVDAWTGAEFVLHLAEDGLRDALDAASGLIDGRLVAHDDPVCIAMLPGAVFHPPDATPYAERVLEAARARRLGASETLDALLRMELRLRALSRVKVGYAYRLEALDGAPAIASAASAGKTTGKTTGKTAGTPGGPGKPPRAAGPERRSEPRAERPGRSAERSSGSD